MKSKDNRGLTLVELLVSIAILAIITVPFLHSFVSSYRVNLRSRQALRATTLAQNEMEILEKEKLEFLKDVSKSGYTTVTENPVDGSYTFIREDVINDDSGRKFFDVYVTMDPMRDISERYESVNNEEVTNINTLSALDTGRYVQQVKTKSNKKSQDSICYKEFVSRSVVANKNKDLAYFEKNVKRNIELNIKKDDKGVTRATVQYIYEAPEEAVNESDKKYTTDTYKIFDNSELKDKDGNRVELKCIYLFFSPRYKAEIADANVITVNNEGNLPVDIYLIRQELNNSDYTAVEPVPVTYKEKLVITDPYVEDSDTEGRYFTNLNFDGTIVDQGAEIELVHYNDTGAAKVPSSKAEAIERLRLTGLSSKEKRDRIYNLEVKVYEADADISTEEALVSLTGTKLE